LEGRACLLKGFKLFPEKREFELKNCLGNGNREWGWEGELGLKDFFYPGFDLENEDLLKEITNLLFC